MLGDERLGHHAIGRSDLTHSGITNGFEEGERPSALYLATNLPTSSPGGSTSTDRGGFVELDYGEGGNVVAMTVHARAWTWT